MDHRPAHLVRATQQRGRAAHLAGGHETADPRRRDGLAVRGGQRHAFHAETALGPEPFEHRDVSPALATEVEVGSHDDVARLKRPFEDVGDEVLSRLLRACTSSKVTTIVTSMSQSVEQLELLFEVGEEEGGRIGSHHGGRVAVEGHHGALETTLGGAVANDAEYVSVPEVHAVVRADSDHRAWAGPSAAGRVARHPHRPDASRGSPGAQHDRGA